MFPSVDLLGWRKTDLSSSVAVSKVLREAVVDGDDVGTFAPIERRFDVTFLMPSSMTATASLREQNVAALRLRRRHAKP